MKDHEIQTSPQTVARIGGALYLIIIVMGMSGELFVRNRLIVSGDPTATAERIKASEFLWRASIAGELFMLTCAVVLALIFYVLLRPVSRDLALLAVLFNLVSIAVEASNKLQLLATLFPLGNADYLKALDPKQLHALAYFSTRAHGSGFGVSLIFFGCECLVLGYLIWRSGYLPGVIGLLMQVAGLCYLTSSFGMILFPSSGRFFLVVFAPIFVAETSLCLWLLTKGVNAEKWAIRAHAP